MPSTYLSPIIIYSCQCVKSKHGVIEAKSMASSVVFCEITVYFNSLNIGFDPSSCRRQARDGGKSGQVRIRIRLMSRPCNE